MIKHWQSMQDYKCFLRNSKVSFDSSERIRLHTELWRPWQKLRLLDIDIAMDFLLPFYSSTGRPAKNQPQILRSFLLSSFSLWSPWALRRLPSHAGSPTSPMTASLPLSSAALWIPSRLSALILTLWTASGSMLSRLFIPGRNSSPLPGIPQGLTSQMGSIRKLSSAPSTSPKGLPHVF